MPKVIILSVSAGAGHMRAAAAIGQALSRHCPSCAVEVVDTFRYVRPFLQKTALPLYLQMVRVTPRVYGYLYRKLENGRAAGRSKVEFNRMLNRLAARQMAALIAGADPAALVCTNPFPLGILDYLKRRGRLFLPVVAALTDFTVHPFWVFPSVDLYLLGHEDLVAELVAQGIEADRAVVTGIPIDPVFAAPCDAAAERLRLGLVPDRPTVLVMGGGLGMGPLAGVVSALGRVATPMQLLVVAGSNTALQARLERLAPLLNHPCRVFGFVGDIHRLVGAADLMVGKAGGLSCAEALAAGVPILVIDPIPGQEERNAEFLTRRGAARLVEGAAGAAATVEAFLRSSAMQATMRGAARSLGRPGAALAAARAVGSLAGWEEGGAGGDRSVD